MASARAISAQAFRAVAAQQGGRTVRHRSKRWQSAKDAGGAHGRLVETVRSFRVTFPSHRVKAHSKPAAREPFDRVRHGS